MFETMVNVYLTKINRSPSFVPQLGNVQQRDSAEKRQNNIGRVTYKVERQVHVNKEK